MLHVCALQSSFGCVHEPELKPLLQWVLGLKSPRRHFQHKVKQPHHLIGETHMIRSCPGYENSFHSWKLHPWPIDTRLLRATSSTPVPSLGDPSHSYYINAMAFFALPTAPTFRCEDPALGDSAGMHLGLSLPSFSSAALEHATAAERYRVITLPR
jgi:hypothetical protein